MIELNFVLVAVIAGALSVLANPRLRDLDGIRWHFMLTRNFTQYQTYLRSPRWKEQRKIAMKRARGRCQWCNWGPSDGGGRHLELHHRSYDEIGHEYAEDLTMACAGTKDSCHERLPKSPYRRNKKSGPRRARSVAA